MHEWPRTNVQIAVEKQQALYLPLNPPLLAQLAWVHRISVREFASIFGISKSTASNVLNMTRYPDMVLAQHIARYFEVTVDDLWGWLVNDKGVRRPLVVEAGGGRVFRLKSGVKAHSALALVKAMAEQMRETDELSGNND